jgi:predicted RNA polymerase sigma factor
MLCPDDEQDRSAWDRAALAEDRELIVAGLRSGRAGRYFLQAAIASLYAGARAYEETDWPQIVALHYRLLSLLSSPVVALNRTVPASIAHGPAVAADTGRSTGAGRPALPGGQDSTANPAWIHEAYRLTCGPLKPLDGLNWDRQTYR